jgi:outer membrane protein TolC
MKQFGAVVALLLMIIGTAGSETYRFTLEEAIAYGLSNSTAIKSKQLAVAAAQADLAAGKSAYYPSLSAGASWTYFSDPFPLTGDAPVGFSIDAAQTVYAFGKIKGGIKLAEEAVAQAALDMAEENRKTIVLIKNAFYGFLLALEVAAINEETLASKEEAFDVARQRYNAGLVADFEVLQAESDLESFKATVISADNGVRIALLNVKNVLGIEEEDFEFELIGELELIPVEIDREALIQTALRGKYDLQSFRKVVDITAAQEQLNRSLRLPTLAAWANYSVQSGYDNSGGKNDYSLDAWEGGWQAGLNLSVPLSGFFPWGEESATIKKTQLQVEDLRIQYGALESSVRIAVESNILKIDEERAKISSGNKSVDLAQRLYDAAVDQYESGYISSVELKDAQLGLNAARLAYAQAIYNYNRNILDLMDVVGVASF